MEFCGKIEKIYKISMNFLSLKEVRKNLKILQGILV